MINQNYVHYLENIDILKRRLYKIFSALLLIIVSSLSYAETEKSSIIAAVPEHFPPQYDLDSNGNSVGFAIDLMNAIAAKAEINIEYRQYATWPEVFQAIDKREADLIPNLGISQKRLLKYAFTKPVETFPISIFVRDANTHINNFSDLIGKEVAVVDGNIAKNRLSQHSTLKLHSYHSANDALFALLSSEVEAVIYPAPALQGIATAAGIAEKIKVVGEPVFEVKRGIATSRDNIELITRLNTTLIDFIGSAEYQKIYSKWHSKPQPYWTIERFSWLMLVLFLITFVSMGLWRYRSVMVLNSQLIQNINERQTAEQALSDNQELQRDLLNNLPDLVWLKDSQGKYLACNAKFEKLYGRDSSEIIGKTDFELVDKTTANYMREQDAIAIELGRANTTEETVVYSIDGHSEQTETIKAPLYKPNGELIGVLGVGRDITERKRYEDQIMRQAHFDSLTNLPNRFLLLDRLSQLISEADSQQQCVATLFVDLDNFKNINDTLGHEIGDSIIIEASKRISGVIENGESVGRLGGDEFVVISGALTDLERTKAIAENLLEKFREPFSIKGRKLVLTASIGIAIYPDDSKTPSELLRNADSAMFHAKQDGRNTYTFFTDKMNQDVARRLELEEQLHSALNKNEFEVFYQPKINLQTGKIMGAEALLRWHNEELGSVSPVEFIPLAEQTGAISEIGKFVIAEAIQQAGIWQKQYLSDFNIAINLSPRQFKDNGLISCIQSMLDAHQLNAETLEMEITEGVLMDGGSKIQQTLKDLNEMNIKLSMDDFGTGYSSLSYLRRYPFDTLKIDRSFISDVTIDEDDYELVQAAIDMSHALKLNVVAEGIETQEQLQSLQKMGCDYGQGYLFGKPVSAKEFEHFFKKLT